MRTPQTRTRKDLIDVLFYAPRAMLRNKSKALLLVLLFGVILVVLFSFLLFFGEIGVSFVVVAVVVSVCHSMQNTRAYRRPHFNKAVFAVHFPLSSPPLCGPTRQQFRIAIVVVVG